MGALFRFGYLLMRKLCMPEMRIITIRQKYIVKASHLIALVFCPAIVNASFSGPTTANRMIKGSSWEAVSEMVLLGLLVAYPLLMWTILTIVAKVKNWGWKCFFKWFYKSLLIAFGGVLLAIIEFVFIIISSIMFINFPPLIYYLILIGYLIIMSYRLVIRAIRGH